ncbi:MAG: hypothetical protein GC165_01790 [Armatimonadetes bacterium]|nr:hypothetical protein [Armatimonadota bacterium]MBS1726987.1 hypothetical protein [Armatimonadota bacterium]
MVKSRINPIVAFIIMAIGVFISWSFIRLFIGNARYNDISDQYMDADALAKVFKEYPLTHDGCYPAFRNSNEVLDCLSPFLAKEASKVSDSGHPRTTMTRLESMARKAVWNLSLSGARAKEFSDDRPPWVFYLPAIHSSNRFVVGYADGKFTNKARSELDDVFQRSVWNP